MSLATGQALSLAVAIFCLAPGKLWVPGHQCQRQMDAVWAYQLATTSGLLNLVGGAGLAIAAQKRDGTAPHAADMAQMRADQLG